MPKKVISVSKGGKITIPREYREKLGIKNGDQIVIENRGGELVLLKLKIEGERFGEKL